MRSMAPVYVNTGAGQYDELEIKGIWGLVSIMKMHISRSHDKQH